MPDNKFKVFIGFLLLFLLSACGASDSANMHAIIDDAEAAARQKDFAKAIALSDELVQSPDSNTLTWLDYCRLAIVYSDAYDHDVETQSSMASATKCISRALTLSSDSVEMFINALPPESSTPLNTALQTLIALNTDRSALGVHEEDEFGEEEEADHHDDNK